MSELSIIPHLSKRYAVCALALSIVLAACAPADDAWSRARETGVLRVGMDASFVPFEYVIADGTLVGYDVDLARELGRRLGPALNVEGDLEVQFVANLPYDGLYDALQVGRVDVVISALVIDPARMADFAYSAAYFDAGQVLVVRRKETAIEAMAIETMAIETMDDLEGCTLAVEFGTQGDMEGRRWARKLTGLTVVPYQTAAEALDAVAAGEAQAALVDHVSALIGTQAQEGLAVVGDPVVGEPYAVAVHRDSQHLLKAIDQALIAMEADGTMERLMAEWLKGGP